MNIKFDIILKNDQNFASLKKAIIAMLKITITDEIDSTYFKKTGRCFNISKSRRPASWLYLRRKMDYTPEFEKFWQAYPKRWNRDLGCYVKRKKYPAFQKWQKLSQR